MGTTRADFHSVGDFPEERDRLNTFARGEAMLSAVALSIYAHIPSTPFAFFTFRHSIRYKMSSEDTVHSCGISESIVQNISSVRGG